MEAAIAAFLRPFVLLLLGVLILYPARNAAEKFIPEGKTKRFLLTKHPVVMTIGVFVGYSLLVLLVTKIY